MTQREKLIVLIRESVANINCEGCTPTERKCKDCISTKQADYLLSRGVVVDGYPCDLCDFNPPSSLDGKPCTICPAQRTRGERHG